MFKIFAASLIALSFSAFAQETTYCFKATARVPRPAPQVVCLESIYNGYEHGIFRIDSKNHSLPQKIDVLEIRKHNEDRFKFTAESLLLDWNERPNHCGDALELIWKFAGESQNEFIDPKTLKISLDMRESNDPCHFEGYESTVVYELVK